MLTVSVPTADAVEKLGSALEDRFGSLDDLEIVVWDGTGTPPDGAERIEMFVGRYNAPPPTAETLAGLPALRVVQLLSAGVEPWLAVVPSGVPLCNGRGIHGASTAELGVAGMLAVLRELPRFVRQQAEQDTTRVQTRGLDGARVLVLGAGDIGRRIATVAEALDAEVTLVARRARDGVRTLDEVPDLLPSQDVVVIAVPVTPETDGLVDAGFLAAMRTGALLVNIARGAVVDTSALLAELVDRRLYAFLDVVDPEPLPAGHPLWDAPNLLFTPHVGGGTLDWDRRAYRLVAAQLARLRAGEDLANVVTDGY